MGLGRVFGILAFFLGFQGSGSGWFSGLASTLLGLLLKSRPPRPPGLCIFQFFGFRGLSGFGRFKQERPDPAVE